MYFPLLFPCRPVAALTHAVNDKLSFNEVDTSEQFLLLWNRASIYTKKMSMFIPKEYYIFDVMLFFFFFFTI